MKLVCIYDENRKLIGRKFVEDDYQLAVGETFVKPTDDLWPPYTLNVDGTAWSGLSLEEYQAQNKPKPQPKKPDPMAQAINYLGLQVATQNAKIKQLESKLQK